MMELKGRRKLRSNIEEELVRTDPPVGPDIPRPHGPIISIPDERIIAGNQISGEK